MPAGRPSKFTQKLAEEICLRMTEGESLSQVCRDDHIPARATIMQWLLNKEYKEFHDQYLRAREALMDFYADEIIRISDDDSRDVFVDDKGRPVSDNTAVNRDRLRADNRKWIMCKLAPKKYGDLQKIEHAGEVQTTAVLEIARSARKK